MLSVPPLSDLVDTGAFARDIEDDRPRLECGVFGIYGMDDASAVTVLGLHALQHRGQEACGVASCDGRRFYIEREHGLVGDVFTGYDLTQKLQGHSAIGHTRYSTAGGAFIRNVQPMFADLDQGGIAIAHNGNLTNFMNVRTKLVAAGSIFQSTSDSEVILHLVARSRELRIIDRFMEALRHLEGGFALVALTRKMLIGARDPLGIRPLVIGKLNNAYVLASETCALDMIGATFVRDVEHGEVVQIDENGLKSYKPFDARAARPCLFEYVYFARPDSVVNGKSIYEVRKAMGRQLAIEHAADADVVVPVPDSGVPASLGFAEQSGLPFELGIIRNHYVGRTFIQPTQHIRDLGVRKKHSPNRVALEGKRVILIDDSIVRGTTSVKIVRMVREAGAKEVHLRSASPPIMWPDFYGIDMPDREKLLAANHTLEEMRQMLECDSLGFLSVEGLYKAMGHNRRDPETPQFTDHYFTGDYPTPLTDREQALDESSSIGQLSLLASSN
ncbi:amidophosphoribosyltransferase [Asticcacaulis biprosthecium C19]|uniref:Amidophosphoribosyltransferase n=1 Tax=Asticcacaulis biprosthecium C19 TaxID=715226 RepID=F4QRF4_9CAUL|nr:amidophosphoribosyltransferase [Asticcacaulis biprosthecium]EGF90791.1 amidophosphoribosyltransferase [Asticcacaulis biprosthecium C19]